MPIKDIPKHLRPREKAFLQGVDKLDDIELLALFLRSGSKDFDVIDVARALLNKFKTLKGVAQATIKDLCQTRGVGKIKALELKAILELSMRINNLEELEINDFESAVRFARPFLSNETQEKFLIILLNTQNQVIYYEIMYTGSEDRIPLNPKDVVSLALKRDAKKFYCFHNHPSGDTRPSEADKLTNKRILYFSELFGIKMLGHLIINRKGEFSIID